MNLNKYLSQAGVASRRKTVDLIKEKMVTVNGHLITDPNFLVPDKAQVFVGKKLICKQAKKYILLNKPCNYVTTVSDEHGRRTVLDLLGNNFKERLYPVGRLDRETTGLLLLTNDGDFAQAMAHPRHHMKKKYEVALNKPLTSQDLVAIRRGVRLTDGFFRVDFIEPLAVGRTNCRFNILLRSGRYRIIRRVFEQLDYKVEHLDRVAIGRLTKRGLPVGSWRLLGQAEVRDLLRISARKSAVGQ